MFGLGIQEVIIVGAVAVMLFGKRLPEVARSLGSSYNEFRKGISELQSHVNDVGNTVQNAATSPTKTYRDDLDDYDEPTAPKFEPPTSKPTESS